MLRFVVLTTLVATALAGGYGSGGYGGMGGGSYGGGSSYGGSQGGYSSGGYGGSGGYSSGGSSYGGGVVTGAVQSRRSVSFYDVPSTYSNAQPLTIDLPSGVQPLNFRFSSRSSPINIESHHEGSQGSYQETSSTDEPHVRVHTVTRPLVQKLNEIITPYRQIRQEVRPVQETVEQVVARGQEQQSYGGYGGSSYGGNQGGYSSGGYGSGGQGGYSMGGGYGGY